MAIFDNKLFPSVMYLLILTVLLLIAFNFSNIFSINKIEINKNKLTEKYRLTGLATKDVDKNDSNKTSDNEGKNEKEIYTEKAYFFYYVILFFTFIFIIIIIFVAILPVIKNYT